MEKKIFTCSNSIEADNIVERLAEQNIVCRVHDETINKAVVSGAPPGIAIFVNEADYPQALPIIEAIKQERDNFMPWCPKCGGEEVTAEIIETPHGPKWEIYFVVVSLLASVGIYVVTGGLLVGIIGGFLTVALGLDYFRPRRNRQFTCKKCGHKFEREV